MKYFLLLIILILLASCANVKPYQMQHIKDPDMQMNSGVDKRFSNYVFSIREGATPVDNQKASGGCGCN